MFSALEVYYDNALYKFTFDIDIDITVSRTANESCSHADAFMPLDRMKANVSGDEWRTEVMIASVVAV